MKNQKYTGIIILNYNNSQMTFDCLQSMNEKINSYCKIVVVDNGSKQKEKEILKNIIGTFRETKLSKYILDVQGLFLENNIGFACGNKEGIKIFYGENDCEDILILNNDTIFVEDILSPLKRVLWSDNNTAWVMPRFINAEGVDESAIRNKKTFLYTIFYHPVVFFHISKYLSYLKKLKIYKPKDEKLDLNSDKKPCLSFLMSGACFLVKKDVFQEIGDFDNRTFLYFEEDILGVKFQNINKKGYLIPSTKIIHLGGESAKKVSSFFVDKCSIKSAYIYVKDYLKVSNYKLRIYTILTRIWIFIDWIVKSRKFSDLKK